MPEDDIVTPDEEEVEESEEEEPRLLAKKYKSVDELERGYEEAQAALTRVSQEKAELERRGPGEVPSQEPSIGEGVNWMQQSDEQFYERPTEATLSILQKAREIEKRAQANVLRARAELKNDPLYSRVQDELTAELTELPDHMLADPAQSKVIVENIFNAVVGRYSRQQFQRARETPAERKAALENLGVEAPSDPQSGKAESITGRDKEMLAALGLGPDSRKKVIERYTNLEDEL